MKRMFLGLLLAASAAMADVSTNQDDLLSVATAGKTTGTQFEMSKEAMQKANGGLVVQNGLQALYYNGIYSKPFVDVKTSQNSYTRAYRNGSTYSWNNYSYGGYTWMRY